MADSSDRQRGHPSDRAGNSMSGPSHPPAVRNVLSTDALALATVHVASWKAAYRGLLPDEYLEGLRVADRLSHWEDLVTSEQPDRSILLAVVDEKQQIRGFSGAGPTNDAELDTAELNRIYLEPAAWGKGLGRLLIRTTRERLWTMGYVKVLLWVHSGNVRARRFYEADGWMDDSISRTAAVWGVNVPETRYRRGLP